jgi:dihydroorotate dehydrogenase (NAD+) catalytic subunit
VIGLGGIQTPEDILEYLVVGASAVQVGTASFWDPKACLRLLEGLEKVWVTHKLPNINDLRGSFNPPYH